MPTTDQDKTNTLLNNSRVLLPDKVVKVKCAACGKPFKTNVFFSGARIGQPQHTRCPTCRPPSRPRKRGL